MAWELHRGCSLHPANVVGTELLLGSLSLGPCGGTAAGMSQSHAALASARANVQSVLSNQEHYDRLKLEVMRGGKGEVTEPKRVLTFPHSWF